MDILLFLVLVNGLFSYGTNDRLNDLEQTVARQNYLMECNHCDTFSRAGTPSHEECIIRATRKWEHIKRVRGWK